MVKIKGKVFKTGSSYALTLPKALVDAEVIKNGQYLELELPRDKNVGNGMLSHEPLCLLAEASL